MQTRQYGPLSHLPHGTRTYWDCERARGGKRAARKSGSSARLAGPLVADASDATRLFVGGVRTAAQIGTVRSGAVPSGRDVEGGRSGSDGGTGRSNRADFTCNLVCSGFVVVVA